jgi:hypothetical protein
MCIDDHMMIARRPPDDDAETVSGDAAVHERAMAGSVVARPAPASERPEVPAWALALGVVLVVVFVGLIIQTYTGRPLLDRLAALLPGAGTDQVSEADRSRVFYVPGETVQVGKIGIGSRGQDRAFQVGDVVLLGATRRLVRLESGGRLTELRAPEGTSLQVMSLGPWDPAQNGLAGLTARFTGGNWILDAPELQLASTTLRVRGGPEEELSPGFQLSPPTAGRVRWFDTAEGSTVRIRPVNRVPSLALESWDPLPTLENAAITVQATVRGSIGANVELALNDVIDASGTVQKTVERQTVAREEEWITLRIQRRVLFGSPKDRFSIGLLEVRTRDWLEVRELGVYLGILP